MTLLKQPKPSTPTTMPSNQPKLLSLHKLQYVAAAKPVDTFYRACDLTLGHFEALAFVSSQQQPQCRLIIADACKKSLEAVHEYGWQELSTDGVASGMMDKVIKIVDDIAQHAAIDEKYREDLDSFRKILLERPKNNVPKNAAVNHGTAYGQNAGDGAHFNYGGGIYPSSNVDPQTGNRN